MTAIRTSYVRAMAEKVLKESGVREPPVDLKMIVERKGYVYLEVDTFPDNVSALFIAKDGKKYALVNARHHPHRKRFSLAHELGHILLCHATEDLDEVSSIDAPPESMQHYAGGDPREKEANVFASALLMPVKMLKAVYSKGADIEKLATVFGVSQQAMTIAVMNNLSTLTKQVRTP